MISRKATHKMKAVIPAAGLGTRFLPATKCTPKELLPVGNKPVIQYVVEEGLAPDGVDGVVIVTSHEKPSIENYFTYDHRLEDTLARKGKDQLLEAVREVGDMPVTFRYQDEPRGLGHAVRCAAEDTGDEPFYVLLGDYFVPDNMMLKRMKAVSDAHGGASVIAVAPCPEDEISRYGVIAGECVGTLDDESGYDCRTVGVDDRAFGAVWRVDGMVEKPPADKAPSNLYIVGRYLLTPTVMRLLDSQEPGAGGEIQLTDAMLRSLNDEEMYAIVVDPSEGCDTGTPAAWVETNAKMAGLIAS